MNLWEEEDLRGVLERQCHDAGSQRAWAGLHNVTPQYVCDILQGKRKISNEIAKCLGFRRVIRFEPHSHSAEQR